MNQDEAFIADIVAHPEDPSLRLIYADWLEEHGDPRAEYLRLHAQASQASDAERPSIQTRLRKMGINFNREWLMAIDQTAVENCSVEFEYRCPRKWESLTPTEHVHVRFCSSCEKPVYYCADVGIAQDHATAGHCIAVDSSLARTAGDTSPDYPMGLVDVKLLTRGRFPAGTLVRITGGPERGQEGVVLALEWDGRHVTVRLDAPGPPREVMVPPSHLADRFVKSLL